MKMIAIQTVKADGAYVAPGGEFSVGSTEEAKALIAAGAAREKGRADDGETKVVPVSENTAPKGPASGATSAPDPQAVADAAKGRTGR
ncbi:hypothetical protein [Methylobacterium soli]|uniref:Uncharacterized protein n=1 Tax=Methylobacterium soli TaxID=553447 RepID=A0A6L3T0H2_9HYPH|nr:hypothetical protein [Methylobacterium soli]KAB1079425.1 hypothetical protein F6X53_11520 [Methylobacterium soli]GJE45360.1 hypothetical protein AEGHOMDF_4554 [Methylobacterium soli]